MVGIEDRASLEEELRAIGDRILQVNQGVESSLLLGAMVALSEFLVGEFDTHEMYAKLLIGHLKDDHKTRKILVDELVALDEPKTY